jgi:hypothetical protein
LIQKEGEDQCGQIGKQSETKDGCGTHWKRRRLKVETYNLHATKRPQMRLLRASLLV